MKKLKEAKADPTTPKETQKALERIHQLAKLAVENAKKEILKKGKSFFSL